MSHRAYLYNISSPAVVQDTDVMVMEWGYEVPLLLQPLLIDEGFVAGNIYNTHTDPENFGLYYNAEKGIQNIKRFYNFIENHQSALIDDIENFTVAKEKMFRYLDNLSQPYIHVDAWDVFNMSDESHQQQANDLLTVIAYNNNVITRAIDADDISLLTPAAFAGGVMLGFSDFRSLLNYPGYDYGFRYIYEQADTGDTAIFEENGLWGLKDKKGEILAEAIYDEFYGFDEEEELAVVAKDGKYGYIHKSGKMVVQPVYNDAYGFDGGYAVVNLDGKYGLIQSNGNIKLPPRYDDLSSLTPLGSYWSAGLDGKYGVINADDKVMLPFDYNHEIKVSDDETFYTIEEEGAGSHLIFSGQFVFLGKFDPAFVKGRSIYHAENFNGEVVIFEVLKHPYQAHNVLLSSSGEILLADYTGIIESWGHAYLVSKNDKQGLFKYPLGLVLDFDFDVIEDLRPITDEPITAIIKELPERLEHLSFNFCKVTANNQDGLFFICGDFSKWLLAAEYAAIEYLKSQYIAVHNGANWAVYNIDGSQHTGFEFEELISLISYTGIAYGIKGAHVSTIIKEGIVPADKMHLQDYVEANEEYGYYYFTEDVQKKFQAYIDEE
ncbi:WG repeat-containing protein [Chitinophaga sp. RCC_12]|uniref:WG repeat-containing protein n=1 Tax=Chitinophaga sp. RCC_12 TaxID=3239226 RepID=UPI003525ACB3